MELMLAVFFHNQHVCPSCYLSELCIDMVQDSLEKNDRILTNFDVWTRHLNELQNAFFKLRVRSGYENFAVELLMNMKGFLFGCLFDL